MAVPRTRNSLMRIRITTFAPHAPEPSKRGCVSGMILFNAIGKTGREPPGSNGLRS